MLFYIQPKITLTEVTCCLRAYYHVSFKAPVLIGTGVTAALKMVCHSC